MGEAETTAATLDVEIGGLGGEVTLADLFPSPWVESHCEAASISEFLEESGFAVADQDSFESIPTHELDRYVDANTEFDDWQAMLSAGVERYVLEQGATGEAAADAADEVEAAEEGDSADAETEDSLEAGV
ncbi:MULTISPECIES: hypothetical protein [Haloferax]|jgi:hypothetical protein|uniref:Uncharacterized protein n=6 Tax=Haloferax TaxID=2251 RepID=A0A384KV21_HALVD|nr:MULTISPECIES: hypothetical protein [Haloferax]ADE02437.1 uncharacterized protein HVO_2931 [Haloferax volcanii DS2]ELK54286.1 hypothetical protein D320_10871 [Haloferax sp. BAB-2207]ELY24541.1 hypothetical protein C498_17840 [Haloferax volcanii DS2]ELZ79139.1 hypothetical protein C456_00025 [Haloferax lucentense DSM 14919]ELZ86221.1 hypothetical protein C452_18409 [Haloferax alexandrinus JCM 10717]